MAIATARKLQTLGVRGTLAKRSLLGGKVAKLGDSFSPDLDLDDRFSIVDVVPIVIASSQTLGSTDTVSGPSAPPESVGGDAPSGDSGDSGDSSGESGSAPGVGGDSGSDGSGAPGGGASSGGTGDG